VVRQVGYPDPATFFPTLAQAAEWLETTLADVGVEPNRTVLGGFSQGAVMSYALGLGAGRPRPAGILAMSGFVPQVEGFELDLSRRAGLPVSISHGSLDPIISVDFGRTARELLESGGLDVSYREDPVGHQIAQGAVAQARSVLAAALL
jgi:phospholipase/carboxylesterase